MSATAPHMFAIVRQHGYGKREFVSLPYVSALLDPMETPRRYYTLSEDEPMPVVPRRRRYEDGDGSE